MRLDYVFFGVPDQPPAPLPDRRDVQRARCGDGAHAGGGGIDSGGSLPLPQHRADAQCGGKCEWSFVLRPFSRGDGTIEEMAAEAKDRPNFEPLQLDES